MSARPSAKDMAETVLAALQDRETWDERQAIFYDLLHDGLPRGDKPFPGAADMHYPLCDDVVDLFKPFYSASRATNPLARFIGMEGTASKNAPSMADWFDYQLREKSNFSTEIPHADHYMLASGRGVIKTIWDKDAEAIRFNAIQPTAFAAPADCNDLREAPWLLHILTFTRDAYEDMPNYRQGEEFVTSITGGEQKSGDTKEETKYDREGITRPRHANQVILWEIWRKTKEKKWEYITISPLHPEEPARDWIACDYEHGEAPFTSFQFEVTEKGWYAPRGITEILAPFEMALCRMWNEKLDCTTFYNRPMFEADGTRSELEGTNIEARPGEIIPHGLKPVKWGEPPIDFTIEMQNTRSIAEKRIKVPDFGIANQTRPGGNRTAREIEEVSTITTQNVGHRGTLYQLSLTRLYRQAYALLCQYGKKKIEYVSDKTARQLDGNLFKSRWEIHPATGPDSWNRGAVLQRAYARFGQLRGDPFIDQGELRRDLLEKDEPGLLERLFVAPESDGQDQQEAQAIELAVIAEGYVPRVKDGDNHAAHIATCAGWIEMRSKANALHPYIKRKVNAHIADHLKKWGETDPKAAAVAAKSIFAHFRKLDEQLAGAGGQAPSRNGAMPQQGPISAQMAPPPGQGETEEGEEMPAPATGQMPMGEEGR
jgi:hypothetical protein